MHEEDHEGAGGYQHCDCIKCTVSGAMKKEFKLAMLEKKEKMLKVKLEFIGKMKEMISKMPDK
jgi:hypothetical protein